MHQPGDCEEIDDDGRLCSKWAMFTMVRIDNTTLALCTRHANAKREVIEANPDRFNPVRFVTVK